MKKKLFTLFCIGLTAFSLSGQNVLIEENFDAFTVGDKIVQTINDQTKWDTWSSAPGGSEDAAISNTFSSSPDNSIYLANNNDIVLLLDDKTEGRYQVNFKALIESGKIGYFNMLHEFAGGSSQWAFQVYFNTGGSGSVDAGSTGAATFSYEYDTWQDISVIVDLDDDFATFYLDGEEVISWKWSLGTSGGGTLVKLDAINFYGITDGGSSGMYIDDVLITDQLAPEAPANLTASVQNESEAQLLWDAPVIAPDSYVLLRNNTIIKTDITDTEYVDTPYPGLGNYTVRAHTLGAGYSHSSNEASVEIPGGLDRGYVLFEVGTGTGCVYCPGAAMGVTDMTNNGDEVIIIKYHNYNSDDPFNTPASAERAANYYGIEGYPTSFADGTLSLRGGNPTSSLYETYHQHYVQRKSKQTLYSLDVNVFHLEGFNYRAEISVQQNSAYNGEMKTLHTALTESDIDFSWFNQDQIHWACRNMFPDAMGTVLDFSETESHSFNLDFSLEEGFVKDNCEFVVFLQADPSKEVMVATKVDMANVLLNSEFFVDDILKVYPNPVENVLILDLNHEIKYTITDINGKTHITGSTSKQIDVSALEQGIYFLNASDMTPIKIVKQ